MHVILEPKQFLDRVDSLLSRWRDIDGMMLRICTHAHVFDRVYFECDARSVSFSGRIRERGGVWVDVKLARETLLMFSGISKVELKTQGASLVVKQLNFMMSMPFIDDNVLHVGGRHHA